MSLADYIPRFDETFDTRKMMVTIESHKEIPAIAICLYLAIVFLVPKYMATREPIPLKSLFKLWNFGLAAFSILGAYNTIPTAYHFLTTKGLPWTVCTHPLDGSYYSGDVAIWYFYFGMSKIPELGDTMFLVAQKKPVIFLHWYHHVSVLVYCWNSYYAGVGAGMYFAAMNFGVHSIMYTYYFLMCYSSTRQFVKRIAIFITSLQLLQMVGGVAAILSTVYYWNESKRTGAPCHVDWVNTELGFAIYTSYFLLFGALFKKLYGPKPKGTKKVEAKSQ